MQLHITRERREPPTTGASRVFALTCRLVLTDEEQAMYDRYVQIPLFDHQEIARYHELTRPQGLTHSSDHLEVVETDERQIRQFCGYIASTVTRAHAWGGSETVELG